MLQTHFILETHIPFRLISYWIRLTIVSIGPLFYYVKQEALSCDGSRQTRGKFGGRGYQVTKKKVGKKLETVQIINPINIDASLPFRIIRLANLFGTNYDRSVFQSGIKLSVTEWRVMMTLAFHPGINAIDVCRYTGYSEVNVSRALSRMKERGWVYRESDPNDRRKYRLELTTTGSELYNDLEPKGRASIADLKSQLSPSVERQIHKILDKFIKIMEGIVARK